MGSSLSSKYCGPENTQEDPEEIKARAARRQEKKSNSVYYQGNLLDDETLRSGKLLDDKRLRSLTDQVLEMTVCKETVTGHWFIGLYLQNESEKQLEMQNESEKQLEMHYVDNGSVFVFYPEEESTPAKKTHYSPKKPITIKEVLEECLDIVTRKSYSLLSYSCQDFVTEIMDKFTNRKLDPFLRKLGIPVLSIISTPCGTKRVLMTIERDFFNECRSGSLSDGMKFLKAHNNKLKHVLNKEKVDGEIYLAETNKFMYSVLQPILDQDLFEDYLLFLKNLEKEMLKEIKEEMLKALRLVNFIIAIDQDRWKNITDLMAPVDAHNQYRYKIK